MAILTYINIAKYVITTFFSFSSSRSVLSFNLKHWAPLIHPFRANSLAKSIMGNRMRSQETGEGGLWDGGIAESED